MATLFFCNKLMFYNQLRKLHRSAVTFTKPTFNLDKERKELQAVLPEVVNSLITGPLPEVGRSDGAGMSFLTRSKKKGRNKLRDQAIRIQYEWRDATQRINCLHCISNIRRTFSEEIQHSARVLGWSLEMACFLLADDVIDGALTRRGKPCWYTLPNIGYSAAKDVLLMYQSIKELLNIHFGKTPFYIDIISLINETVYQVSMGEYLDCSSGYNKKKNNIDVLTVDRCNAIATYKSGYYWLKLPIFVALFLIRDRNKKATEELNYICITLGRLLQFQDDYIDAYGDETVTGKNGRDIQEGKCSWLAVTALKRCNKAQHTIFREYYGSKEPEHVKRIKQIYDESKLNKVFEQYERTVYDDLLHRIHALPTERETQFLLDHLNLHYFRRLY